MNKWFRNPIVYVAMVVAIFCGLAFVGAGLPGFGNMPDGTKQMKIVVVDHDQSTGSKAITESLKENMPFKVKRTDARISSIKSQLNDRSAALAVEIPQDFIKDIRQQRTPNIKFYVNDSNGMLQNSLNRSIISQMESKIKDNITSKKTVGMVAGMIAPEIAKQASTQAQKQAEGIKNPAQLVALKKNIQRQTKARIKKQASQITQKLTGGVTTSTVHLNKIPKNYQYQLAPMFLNLGSYLGVMIMALILTMTFMSARFKIGKTKAYLSYQISGFIASVILPFFTVGLLRCEISFSGSAFWSLVGSQILFVLAVFEFTSIFTFLCGSLPGMLLLLPMMTMQVVAGGGILPRVVLSGFYQWFSRVTPMYQGITNAFNALYGGSFSPYNQSLLWIALTGVVCSTLFALIGYRQKTQGTLSSIIKFN
ncbi:YhgE/Pip domain-containing protein [Lentilactobacillus sp. SPB1-3]|uniref:YhgE/Pip domain-containing protein n=1 Tax=Lentilactobacillus terminaliae TaxID=3003483 RepID=A0ACD5DGP1_9LACO|nr:ABC transporter permease [Lentilactobacillus sp. SPB1-3]MCZ0977053.1 ABC transporter permease [Lentilactobacillus sp. SPB1-3]